MSDRLEIETVISELLTEVASGHSRVITYVGNDRQANLLYTMHEVIKKISPKINYIANKCNNEIRFPCNGNRILFRGKDPCDFRGWSMDYILLDGVDINNEIVPSVLRYHIADKRGDIIFFIDGERKSYRETILCQ